MLERCDKSLANRAILGSATYTNAIVLQNAVANFATSFIRIFLEEFCGLYGRRFSPTS